MNTSEIEALIGKYFEGMTTLEEEKILRDFFTRETVPAHLLEHQPLFQFLSDEQEVTLDDSFDEKLTRRILAEQSLPPVVPMVQKGRRNFYIVGLAAGFLLLAGMFFLFRDLPGAGREKENAEMAESWSNAREALLLVSGNLNQGLSEVSRLESVEHAMANLQIFNKFYQYETSIIHPDVALNQSKNPR